METLDKDSKARLERFIEHRKKDEFDNEIENEELFLDLCRVLVFMLLVFALFYGVWFN